MTDLDNISKYVKDKCLEYCNKYSNKAIKVPVLPKVVTLNDIKDSLGKTNELVIGLDKEDLSVCTFDFYKNYATIVTALDIESTKKFVDSLINQYIYLNKRSLMVINADSDYNVNVNNHKYYQYVDKDFDEFFTKLNDFIKTNNDEYKANNYNKSIFKDKKVITCVVIGIDSLKNKLNDNNKTKFGELFNNARNLGIIEIIFVDSVDKFKKIELESWYKNCINNNEGIWIGSGVNEQFSLKISQKIPAMKEVVSDNFCFVVERGKPRFVKYVEEFDLKQ